MKSVVIFTGALSSGGAEKQSILLSKALKDNYKVVIVSFYGEKQLSRYINFLKIEQIEYYQLKGSIIKKIIDFSNFIKDRRPDVIINFLPSNNIIGGFIGKIFNIKVIIGSVRSSRQSFFKYIELLLSHCFFNHATVFNSRSGLEYFSKRGFSKEKSILIPNCILPAIQTSIKNKNKKYINILMVSRFEKYKDYDTALKVFDVLINKYSFENLFFTIVGEGTLEENIKNLIQIYQLENFVEINKNPENIFSYYLNADIFLQTSLFEGLSNSIMEAMIYKLPIVATNVGDNDILVKDDITGYLAPVGEYVLIASKIKKLIESSEKRKNMGNKGCRIVMDDYSIENYREHFVDMIENKII